MKMEDLSDTAKQGLDNYRKAIPRIINDATPIRRWTDPEKGIYDYFFMRIPGHAWTPPVSSIVGGFCLAAGASMEETMLAIRFAKTEGYWL